MFHDLSIGGLFSQQLSSSTLQDRLHGAEARADPWGEVEVLPLHNPSHETVRQWKQGQNTFIINQSSYIFTLLEGFFPPSIYISVFFPTGPSVLPWRAVHYGLSLMTPPEWSQTIPLPRHPSECNPAHLQQTQTHTKLSHYCVKHYTFWKS